MRIFEQVTKDEVGYAIVRVRTIASKFGAAL